MLILSNIKRAHQLPAREAVLSSLPDNFKVVNFEASYLGKDLILLDFPHNAGKYNFKTMLQKNKLGSLLKIYSNDYIPKHMQGENNKLSKFAKELKEKKKKSYLGDYTEPYSGHPPKSCYQKSTI